MSTRQLVSRVLWTTMGAAAILATGCATTMHTKVPVSLSGAQEVPPVTTSASGTVDMVVHSFKCPSALSSDNCPTLFGTVTTQGIKATSVEIRRGAPGQNGPIVATLQQLDDDNWTVPSGTALSPSEYDAYKSGQLYVNVDTASNRSGELRAQLRP